MKNHYVFIHHDTANHIGTGAKWFIVAKYETTGTNGLDTNTLVNSSTHSYFKALEDNRRWSTSPGDSGAILTDQLGYPITTNFPIGEFEDAGTRGPAHLNVVEVRAEGSAASTLSELYQEITTAVASTSQNVTTALSNVAQQSSASVNLSVLSNPTITYPQSSNTGNYPPDFASAMSGNEYDESHFWSTTNPHENQALFQGVDYSLIPSNDLGLNRTDLMFVQKVLENSTGIQDEVKLALSFLLAYAKSNQANTKLLTKHFNKTRSVMNITNLQTLENDYRIG